MNVNKAKQQSYALYSVETSQWHWSFFSPLLVITIQLRRWYCSPSVMKVSWRQIYDLSHLTTCIAMKVCLLSLSSVCRNIKALEIISAQGWWVRAFRIYFAFFFKKKTCNSSLQQCGGIECSGLITSPHYVTNPQSSRSIMAAHSVLIGRRHFPPGYTTLWVCEDENRRRRARLQSDAYRHKHETEFSSLPLSSLFLQRVKNKKPRARAGGQRADRKNTSWGFTKMY